MGAFRYVLPVLAGAVTAVSPGLATACMSFMPTETVLFDAIPQVGNVPAPYALDVEVVSTYRTTIGALPAPEGGRPPSARLNLLRSVASAKVTRVLWGDIDASTVEILYEATSCRERMEVGDRGFVFGRVRRSSEGQFFFYPSKRRVWEAVPQ